MSALITVFKKELRDMLRDRRTVIISLVVGTLLGPVLMFGMIKMIANRVSTQMEKPLVLPVVGAENAPNLVAWLQGQNIIIKPAPNDIDAAIADQSEDVVMRITPEYGTQWRKSLPAKVELIAAPNVWERVPPIRVRKSVPDAWLRMTITEGRNRQVRRMTAAVGHPTLRLIREKIGDWELGELPAGEWREIPCPVR